MAWGQGRKTSGRGELILPWGESSRVLGWSLGLPQPHSSALCCGVRSQSGEQGLGQLLNPCTGWVFFFFQSWCFSGYPKPGETSLLSSSAKGGFLIVALPF